MNQPQVPSSRRAFLRQTLAASAAGMAFPTIIPASALGLSGRPAPSNRITLGVVGTGNQGFNDINSDDHFRNFIDCVISRRPTAAPVEVAHRSITICHLGNIAMRLKRDKLRWDPRTEQIIGDDEAAKMLSRPHRYPWALPVL